MGGMFFFSKNESLQIYGIGLPTWSCLYRIAGNLYTMQGGATYLAKFVYNML